MALYAADFETTTDPDDCRVWAYALTNIQDINDFHYGTSLDEFMSFAENSHNSTFYFRNLKFDDEFIFVWLFEHGFEHVASRKDLKSKSFSTLISDMGVFYSTEIVFEKKEKTTRKITIYDSLKIVPLSIEETAEAFKLPLSKLKIDYKEKREKGHKLTQAEIEYIHGDVTIDAMALKIMFDQGLTQMTQGSNALHDYKSSIGAKNFDKWFPTPDYDDDIRQSYKGGFTYLNPKFKNMEVGEGIVLDVNSLYPSVMYYRPLPYGEGIFFHGEYKPDKIYRLYVQMFTCNFEIKPDYIPTIQLKGNLSFVPTEYITSSNGEDVTLCLTSVDMELFFKHYNVYNITYHSGWKFKATTGLFKEYIDKWNGVKMQATIDGNAALRMIAKWMLNKLYGKFALNPNVRNKNPVYDEGRIRYALGPQDRRKPVYIPVGTFITAWARYITISSAQLVHERFMYADTDSLHLLGTELPANLKIDKTALGMWKHEGTFNRAKYLRQKSYIEEMIVDEKEYNKFIEKNPELAHLAHAENGIYLLQKVTCAGMPSACYSGVNWDNFAGGESFEGKLQPTHVKGGIVLQDIAFTIKK